MGSSASRRRELDRGKREAMLQRMQQLVHERAMVAPIYELAFINGVGRRVEESGLGPHRRLRVLRALRGREAPGEVRKRSAPPGERAPQSSTRRCSAAL